MENHPRLIKAPKNSKTSKQIKLSKHGLSIKDTEEPCKPPELRPKEHGCRQRGEPLESRRERKKSVKEEKRKRRIEKKLTKLAFKDEKVRQSKVQSGVNRAPMFHY